MQNTSIASRLFFSALMLIAAVVIGYLAGYWWTFRDFSDVLNVSALKSQIVATQKSNDVKDQLKDLGYEFEEKDFYQLNNPSSTNYRANVLDGYEPKKVEDSAVQQQGYYFYDKNGMAYYFTLDESSQVDPESFVPLNAE